MATQVAAAQGITDYDWSLIWDYRGDLLRGLWLGIEVSFVSLIFAVVVGMVLAVMRMGKRPITWIAAIYINVFRGMPALVTGLWVYFGLSLLFGINFSVFQAGVITLTLLYSAYLAEIFRAALVAVPNGHREAGHALGMRSSRIFFSVVLPQAMKIALPNVGSMFIGMLKDTSTLAIIGLAELTRETQNLVSQTYQPFVFYTAAALFYVVAAFVIDLIFRLLEGAYSTPPRGWVSNVLRTRQRRRIEQLIAQVG